VELTGNTLVIPAETVDVARDVSTGTQLWQAPELDHPTAAGKYVVGYVGQGAAAYRSPSRSSPPVRQRCSCGRASSSCCLSPTEARSDKPTPRWRPRT
jgi:hypothetical protein